jgi:hypothetical protein
MLVRDMRRSNGSSTFCISMGTSSSFLPQSSSYLHLFFSGGALLGTLASAAALWFCDAPSPEVAHSSLNPASKNPEHCDRISLCSRYRCSFLPFAITISTSPVCVNTGNSFCGWYEEPPKCERCGRCLRVVEVAREECEVTEGGRRMARERSAPCESG